jgi:hypothetical protein
MSANTKIIVKVLKTVESEIEISALTLDEAEKKAQKLEGVIKVLKSFYPGEEFLNDNY